MWSERLQKITSFFLIFFLLFSFTIRIPFLAFLNSSVYATDNEFFNLVSIIVDEDTYANIQSKLVRYSRDIQAQLENTRVVILPTPSDASVLDIASLNESLYYEWYKAHKNVNFESRLIGTVLVGKIPVPVVFDGTNSSKSILPYVDFEEKTFIFDEETQKYQKNDRALSTITPEVWHGIISPNTWEAESDITAIRDYFDKNHDFYSWQGVFNQNTGVIDGKTTDAPNDYDPYVFYYDQFQENKAVQYQKYIGYQMYLQNIEDITYNRYSKELAEKIKDQVLWVQNYEISELVTKVDPSFDISGLSDGPDTEMSSDIATRYITDNSTKRFLEIFNSSSLWDMRKHVFNAGRYNEWWSKVNVDMPPFLISVLDEVSAEVIKNVNTALFFLFNMPPFATWLIIRCSIIRAYLVISYLRPNSTLANKPVTKAIPTACIGLFCTFSLIASICSSLLVFTTSSFSTASFLRFFTSFLPASFKCFVSSITFDLRDSKSDLMSSISVNSVFFTFFIVNSPFCLC